MATPKSKRITIFIVLLILAAAAAVLIIWVQRRAARDIEELRKPVDGATQTTAEANNQFAFDMYAELRKETDGNFFFSPQSISIALAMVQEGARGVTDDQIAKTLHMHSPTSHRYGVRSLLARLNGIGKQGKRLGYELSIANRLYGQEGDTFLTPFLATLRDDYQAELGFVDFAGQTEAARQMMNDWVSNQTSDKISELVPSGAIDQLTRLVLVNAIYFKGAWSKSFDENETRPLPFFLTGGEQAEVPMMHQKEDFAFAKLSELSIIELPYEEQVISMLVILPANGAGLAAVEESISAANLTQWIAGMKRRDISLWLPKFRMTSEFVLNSVLSKLGIMNAFSRDSADFSGMNDKTRLFLALALHKAFVDVNEEGTEAAAATSIIGAKSAEGQAFRVDHPFLFIIRDNASGSILFAGRVTNPQK